MHDRTFGRDPINVSEIGLGTWQLGGRWGDVEDEEAKAILKEARAQGVTFFDTADVYGNGRSERRLARFLDLDADDVFVASKVGRLPEPGWPENFTREVVRRHVEASLDRLGVEALDLIQLHSLPLEVMQQYEFFEWLRELKREGKVKRFGASVESVEDALFCMEQDDLYALQIIFNIFRQKPIDTLFEAAKAKDVALIVRLPVASGLLTGKFTHQTTFAEDDHRTFNRNGEVFNVGETFAGLPFEKGVDLADQVKAWVPDGMTMAQMALRWILDFDAVSVVIPGATRLRHIRDNAAASDLPPLSDDLHARLRAFYATEVHDHIRGPY